MKTASDIANELNIADPERIRRFVRTENAKIAEKNRGLPRSKQSPLLGRRDKNRRLFTSQEVDQIKKGWMTLHGYAADVLSTTSDTITVKVPLKYLSKFAQMIDQGEVELAS